MTLGRIAVGLLVGLGVGLGVGRWTAMSTVRVSNEPVFAESVKLDMTPVVGGVTCQSHTANMCDAQPVDAASNFSPAAPTYVGPQFLDADGNPVAAPPGDHFAFARYRGLPVMPMGDSSTINGAVMHVAQLHTDDSPNDVLRFYRAQFALNHEHPHGGLLAGDSGPFYLAVDSPHAPMRTLTLVPAAHGTMVLASVGTPRPDQADKLPAEFPIPPGGQMKRPHVDSIQDGTSLQRNLAFDLSTSLDEIRKFYETTLTHDGFTLDDGPWEHSTPTSWYGVFRKGSESMSFRMSDLSSGRVTVSVMWLKDVPSKESTQ